MELKMCKCGEQTYSNECSLCASEKDMFKPQTPIALAERALQPEEGQSCEMTPEQMTAYAQSVADRAAELALPAGPVPDSRKHALHSVRCMLSALVAQFKRDIYMVPGAPFMDRHQREALASAHKNIFELPERFEALVKRIEETEKFGSGKNVFDMVHESFSSPAVAQPVADERALFEKEMRKQYGEEHFQRGSNDYGETFYNSSRINGAWDGWKARAALCQPAEEGGKS